MGFGLVLVVLGLAGAQRSVLAPAAGVHPHGDDDVPDVLPDAA